MKMSFGSRFMGCRVDSSERSFGRTSVSNELLAAVIYKHGSKSDISMKTLGGGLISMHLCNSYAAVVLISSHFVSVPSMSITFCSYGRRVPASVDVFIQLSFQQTEELGH